MFSRKIKFVIFACSPAKVGAAHVPKKYAEGVRTLSTPGDAVKLRLRFAPQVLRRYLNFHSMWKRKNSQFIFTPCRHRANTSMFFGNFWLLVILGGGFYILVFVLAFMARKRTCFRERLNLLFLIARPRKLKRLTAADRESWSGTLPPRERSEWGALR